MTDRTGMSPQWFRRIGVIACLATFCLFGFVQQYSLLRTATEDHTATFDSNSSTGGTNHINTNNINTNTINSNADGDDNGDWFDHDRWWNEMRMYDQRALTQSGTKVESSGKKVGVFPFEICEYVEDVCRIPGHNGWVYHPDHRNYVTEPQTHPIVEFYGTARWNKINGGDPSFSEKVGGWNIGYLSYNNTSTNNPVCSYVPVTNHFVLVGSYTHMLGEFYSRVYSPLAELVRFLVTVDHRNPGYNTSNNDRRTGTTASATAAMLRFQKHTRFYLSGKRQLLESQSAFLGMFSDHPSGPSTLLSSLQSMQDMIGAVEPAANATAETGPNNCACVKRLFFCGYVREKKEMSGWGTLRKNPWRIKNWGSLYGRYDSGVVRSTIREQVNAKPHLQRVARDYVLRKKAEARLVPLVTNRTTAAATAGAAFNLTATMSTVSNDDFLRNWKIVGLTQRTNRRAWLNHAEIMNACAQRFSNALHKTLCIEIDVGAKEFLNLPNLHSAAHSRLSALIGIHGAQLTEAAFLPPRSLVVEMLPFVPDGVFGRWTRAVHASTPIGSMFSGTDLTHIGLPLTIASASHIACVADASGTGTNNITDLQRCLGGERKSRWDVRPFTAPVDAVLDLIEKFVVRQHGSGGGDAAAAGGHTVTNGRSEGSLPAPSASAGASRPWNDCRDFQRLVGDDYVLYNVLCAPASNGSEAEPMSPHHYYRSREWLERKTGYCDL